MPTARSIAGSRRVVLALALALGTVVGTGAPSARADRITLRSGQQLKGKVLPGSRGDDRVAVLTGTGKTPLTFSKSQILQVTPEPGPLDDYVKRRAEAPATAEGQHELGLWCEGHALPNLATLHFETAVARDKTFAPARRKLGHVLLGDRWLNGDELREAQGMVKYKGRWITREERDEREAQAALSAEEQSWARRIKRFRLALDAGPDDRRREAEAQLLEIRDPIAIPPLVRVLGDDDVPVRALLDHILGAIPGPKAAEALVVRILSEADGVARDVTMEELGKRREPIIMTRLLQALRVTRPDVVNRAAWALAHLNAVTAVPRLIPALITTQQRVVMDTSGMSAGGGPTISGLPAGYGGSSVARGGAIGAGGSSVPYGSVSSGSVSIGMGGGPASARGPIPRLVAVSTRNVEVRDALIKLTGQDFGFDVPTWQRWVSTSFRTETTPARRVPQP